MLHVRRGHVTQITSSTPLVSASRSHKENLFCTDTISTTWRAATIVSTVTLHSPTRVENLKSQLCSEFTQQIEQRAAVRLGKFVYIYTYAYIYVYI